jgi:methyltransferase-like protein
MDVVRNCSFRQTLLCHASVPLSRQVNLDILEKLHFASYLKPENEQPDLKSRAVERFVSTGDSSIRSPSPPFKAALLHLGAIWPRAASLDELLRAAADRLGFQGRPATITPSERRGFVTNLMQCLASGMIEPYHDADAFVTVVSARPVGSRLARAQAAASGVVTNRRHEEITLDELARAALMRLDGSVDRAGLLRLLVTEFERGRLSIARDGTPIARGERVDEILDKAIDASLEKLAAWALLVA